MIRCFLSAVLAVVAAAGLHAEPCSFTAGPKIRHNFQNVQGGQLLDLAAGLTLHCGRIEVTFTADSADWDANGFIIEPLADQPWVNACGNPTRDPNGTGNMAEWKIVWDDYQQVNSAVKKIIRIKMTKNFATECVTNYGNQTFLSSYVPPNPPPTPPTGPPPTTAKPVSRTKPADAFELLWPCDGAHLYVAPCFGTLQAYGRGDGRTLIAYLKPLRPDGTPEPAQPVAGVGGPHPCGWQFTFAPNLPPGTCKRYKLIVEAGMTGETLAQRDVSVTAPGVPHGRRLLLLRRWR